MPTQPAVSLTPSLLYRFLRRHTWLWAAPAIAGFVLAAVVSVATPRKWEAHQGFLIRSEAAGFAEQRLGKFTDLSEMKAVQETVLELARSQSVLAAALEQVGPKPTLFGRSDYPTPEEIVELRDNMTITPPGGAEFGLTEVFYLTVVDTTPERATRLASALADRLQERLSNFRDERAKSLITELQNSVEAARATRDEHTRRLSKFESAIGADLAELRALESANGGRGELAQNATAIEAELRQNGANRRQSEQLLTVLKASVGSPETLLAAPSALLASQPALERLKSGLVDAQINTAALAGTRSERHPLVQAARNREAAVRAELQKELPVATAGVELEHRLSEQRAEALRAELAQTRATLARLAGHRAEYANLIAAVANHNRLVEVAEDQLADAQAHQAGAKSASVLSRIDKVESGIYPVGPGRTVQALAGGVAGLVLGLGLLFSLHSPSGVAPQPSRTEAVAGPFGEPAYPATDSWPSTHGWPAGAPTAEQAVGAGYANHNGYTG